MPATETMEATFEITCLPGQRIEEVSRDIAFEQTVELPDEAVSSPAIRQHIVGKVGEITSLAVSGRYRVAIAYNQEITAFTAPQLLNVLYGNISLKNNIRIVDLSFTDSFLSRFTGPAYGINAIRRNLGVQGRPLLCTALKPMGSSPEDLARTAYAFARGGGDLIKDDHGLADHTFCPFTERVQRCQEALARAQQETGRKTLYLPSITGTLEQMEEQALFAQRNGVEGILLSPFLIGPDMMRYFSRKYSFFIMSHPALTGVFFHHKDHGIAPSLLLGTLVRLFGADISIYPNHGGRFGFTLEDCMDINRRLKMPMAGLLSSFPAPAGGMALQRIKEMAKDYGPDMVYLIGGALLGYSSDVTANTEVYLDEIRHYFREDLSEPASSHPSSCEFTVGEARKGSLLEHLPFLENFCWQERQQQSYKQCAQESFRLIQRSELAGMYGEHTSFDLRYFEIAPGGYSSLERHSHEHVIICIRGEGEVRTGDRIIQLKLYDIAYIAPMAVHQLRNRQEEPFGFFCIVDHRRDRPFVLASGEAK